MDPLSLLLFYVVYLLVYLVVSIFYILKMFVLFLVPDKFRYKDISEETVLITGGGNGIGRELARKFSKLAANVILLDIRIQDLRETVKMLKIEGAVSDIFIYECDVSKREAVYAIATKIKKEIGPVTILINNAGIVNGKRFMDIPDADILKTMEVNSLAHFWTCKSFLPDMLKSNHGHIVSIASLAGFTAGPRLTDYCASKFAAVGFIEALRMELDMDGYKGIKLTVVAPYHITTKLFEGFKAVLKSYSPEWAAEQIVRGVLLNEYMLTVPTFFKFGAFIPAIFPRRAVRKINELLGMKTSMDEFKGRPGVLQS